MTAIYLAPGLLTGSSRLLETAGQAICFSTALLRDRVYIVEPVLLQAGWALTPPFHPCSDALHPSGISLLHLSWGHPRRALPVIPALRSPDFPHLDPFGFHPRLSDPVASAIVSHGTTIVKHLAKSFPEGYTIIRLFGNEEGNYGRF